MNLRLRERPNTPLPQLESSILLAAVLCKSVLWARLYGPFSHIEGEGKIESQLILGFRHTDSQFKSKKVTSKKTKKPTQRWFYVSR